MNRLFPGETPEFKAVIDELTGVLLHRKAENQHNRLTVRNTVEKTVIPAITAQGTSVNEGIDFLLEHVFRNMIPSDNKRYYSFIPGPASLLSWLGSMITEAFNPHAATWLHSAGPLSVEESVIRYFADKIGYPASAGGLTVSGGSMSNLTALTLARDTKLDERSRPSGVAYVSDQTHASIAKALRMIGFYDWQIRKIASDGQFRMDVGALKRAIEEDIHEGLTPFVVTGSAGTTNTGSIDPLEEIGAICKECNLWFHIDGAYGATVALSASYQHLLAGVELSDSISWDAHKWLFQTYGCGLLLVKDKQHLFNSFNTSPEYLQDVGYYPEMANYMDLGPELTRPARAVKLWFTLSVAGSDAVGKAIDHGIELAQYAQELLSSDEHVMIVSEAQLGIVNFRYVFDELNNEELDVLNRKICSQLRKDFFVVTTRLSGDVVIRFCCIHPLTGKEDVAEMVGVLAGIAREVADSFLLGRIAQKNEFRLRQNSFF